MSLTRQTWIFVLAALASAPLVAQQAPAPSTAAAPASAAPSALPYRALSEHYESYADQKLTPWSEANDTVRRIGGWREYAREARPPAANPAPAASSPAAGAGAGRDPHAGHGKQ
jgi:hypothetical protein